MTRKDFELIAEIIAKELEGECREKAAYAFAYILPTTNGRFDSQRFLKACRVKAFTKGEEAKSTGWVASHGGGPFVPVPAKVKDDGA